MGWGTGSWGSSPWGTGAAAAQTALASVYAVANRTVRVVLTAPPLAENPLADHDALNPSTWVLTRLDTGAAITVLHVEQQSGTVFDLSTLEKLADAKVPLQLDAGNLYDASGEPIGPAPGSAGFPMLLGLGFGQPGPGGTALGPTGPTGSAFVFQGVIFNAEVSDTAAQAYRGAVSTDLANPQFQVSPFAGGTLAVGSHGDYVNVSGAELVQKLLFRRLTTARGGFFHLPDYGFDMQAKRTYAPAELPSLQARIEQELLREPEVEAAQVSITAAPAAGYLTIRASVKLAALPQLVSMPPIQIPGAVIA